MEQNLETAIGARIRSLRIDKGLTLDDLANASGVSRAMISRIERAEASPTASLLARLCAALGLSLSAFFSEEDRASSPLSRREDQRLWRDPETGYLRRAVSPPAMPSEVDIVEVEFPPGARVSFPPQEASRGMRQHVWLFEGRMDMTVNGVLHVLEAGDCLFMALGEGHDFHNPTDGPARYAVVLDRRQR